MVYVQTGHGKNVKLEDLLQADPQYHEKNFQWTILEQLPINITEFEAIEKENLWKRKLLSLQFGYNKN